eukprot:1231327-Ditylum_brightwellii.AAC.1
MKEIAAIIIQKEYDLYVKRKATYKQNKICMYTVACGQCSKAMRAKLESTDEYKAAAEASGMIQMLNLIKKITYQCELQRYPHRTVHTAMRAFYLTSQKEGMTLKAYLDEFNNRRDVVEQYGGDIGVHAGLTENALRDMNIDLKDPNNYSTDDLKEAHRNAKEAYLAFVFLSNANKAKSAPLLRELANSYLRGSNDYPHTVTAAHKLLVGWEGGTYTLPSPSNDNISYTTIGYEEEGYKEPNDEEGE